MLRIALKGALKHGLRKALPNRTCAMRFRTITRCTQAHVYRLLDLARQQSPLPVSTPFFAARYEPRHHNFRLRSHGVVVRLRLPRKGTNACLFKVVEEGDVVPELRKAAELALAWGANESGVLA